MIAVKQLSHKYQGHTALNQVSFTVPSGEILGLIGPNGAGKTTILESLAGLLVPDAGEITLQGIDLRTQPQAAQAQLGYLPHQPPLYSHLNVLEHLQLICRLRHLPKSTWPAAIENVVQSSDLSSVLKRYPHHLSRGLCQRVGLAMAMIHQPAILILDEPTTGLDPAQIYATRETLRALKGKHTLVLSSHVLSEVEALCDQVLILHQGESLAQGSPQDLSRSQSTCFRVRLRQCPTAATAASLAQIQKKLAALDCVQDIQTLQSTADTCTLRLEVKAAEQPTAQAPQSQVIQAVFNAHWEVLAWVPEGLASLEHVFLERIQSP